MNSSTRILALLLPTLFMVACASHPPQAFELSEIPAANSYCLEAQRIVSRTTIPMQLIVHEDFNAFVKSKTSIEGPTIHQFNWYDPESNIQGISCKMKSADHLNMAFGAGAAGPDGFCQDMNRQVYQLLLQKTANPALIPVEFDLSESIKSKEQSNMIGPIWLKPFTMTYLDPAGVLHIATKGFVVNFADPRYQKFPPSWRGTHYCHLIAPKYLASLLNGEAAAGAIVGREAERLRLPSEAGE
jgi:hypothetical protein